MQYDAAIIGAGADGLAAACLLARAGKSVLVVARDAAFGDRLVTRQFHPGFRASVFSDSAAPIPDAVLALLTPPVFELSPVPEPIRSRHAAALTRIFADAAVAKHQNCLAQLRRRAAPLPPSWPGCDLATATLQDVGDIAPVVTARALDTQRVGSGLAALTLPRMMPCEGGLASFGAAFRAAATEAGAAFRFGLDANEVILDRGRVQGLLLADGARIVAGAVISTLDFKQSILSLFPWTGLPAPLVARAGAFRMAGGTARLLLALKTPPPRQTPLWLPGDDQALGAWRRGAIPGRPPLLFDPVSVRDPTLAPQGAGVATVSLGAIPYRLFDGGWTHEKRLTLAATALARIKGSLPGIVAQLAAVEIVTPQDIEDQLGMTHGDLDGGEIAPDQMLALRPGPRTAVPGFYYGGPSAAAGPLGTGAAGFAAATALLADQVRQFRLEDLWR